MVDELAGLVKHRMFCNHNVSGNYGHVDCKKSEAPVLEASSCLDSITRSYCDSFTSKSLNKWMISVDISLA